MIVRDGLASDLAAVLDIYTPYIRHGSSTFETVPPSCAAMAEPDAGTPPPCP